jgi:hypothetical protein
VIAEAFPGLLDARNLQHVGADAVNHDRAALINAFIFATATAKPSNSACATIA